MAAGGKGRFDADEPANPWRGGRHPRLPYSRRHRRSSGRPATPCRRLRFASGGPDMLVEAPSPALRIPMQPIISVANISKTYASGFRALKGVNLDIRRGEIFG